MRTRMKMMMALGLAAALFLAACGSDDDDGAADDPAPTTETGTDTSPETSTDTNPEPDDTVPVAGPVTARDLSIVGIDFEAVTIDVMNNTSEEILLDGYVLCSFPTYVPLEGVGSVGPGDIITIGSTVALPADDGELGIYVGEDFANPDDIVAYVEWGSSGHTRSPVAVAAGIWDGIALTPDGTYLGVGSSN